MSDKKVVHTEANEPAWADKWVTISGYQVHLVRLESGKISATLFITETSTTSTVRDTEAEVEKWVEFQSL